MRFLVRAHQIPPRVVSGVFILNSGMTKARGDEATAAGVYGMASGAYPFLKGRDPKAFMKAVSTAEIVLGAALLVPVVPSLLAGAALTAFAGGLLGMYLRLPGLRQEGSLRPTQQGLAIAKDCWLLGIGLGLVLEELGD